MRGSVQIKFRSHARALARRVNGFRTKHCVEVTTERHVAHASGVNTEPCASRTFDDRADGDASSFSCQRGRTRRRCSERRCSTFRLILGSSRRCSSSSRSARDSLSASETSTSSSDASHTRSRHACASSTTAATDFRGRQTCRPSPVPGRVLAGGDSRQLRLRVRASTR
jgi:hypothetical protein